MTNSPPFSIQNILFLICVLCINTSFSQDQSTTTNTLFGKTISSRNANPNSGFIRCASTEYEKSLQENNPKRLSEAEFEAWINPLVKQYKANRTSSKTAGTIITIPVVVHVIHNSQTVGTAPNITDNQVISQITVLNQDFRKIAGTPGGSSTNPVAADVEIQFVLAQQDPNGNPTNGINRVGLCKASWSEIDIEGTLKPSTIWDPTKYLNMWCLKLTDNKILGYARFPDNSGLAGFPSSNGTSTTDGVVSSYDVFGSKNFTDGTFILSAPYNEGRTMSHEVGHWLGLRHIWGDGGSRDDDTKDCNASDYCDDTPQAGWENYSCVTTDSCPLIAGNDMIENYMDYTNDACMNIFTTDQKNRMITVMNNSPRRKELKTSTKATALQLFANDAEVKLESSCPVSICGGVLNQTTKKIVLYNRGTSILTSAKINYSINGGNNLEYNWIGSLETNKYATFNITINSTTNGNVTVNVVNANGVTDQRATNNTATDTFIIPTSPENYTFNTYKFTLQQDYFGSETSWNIKNSTGGILYKGGPYKDTYVNDTTPSPIPALITQTWTLENNQCYTFTINDSSGDGICCGTELGGSGDGYYNIKSIDGTTTLKSGASFTSTESLSFTTNTLGNSEFENSNDVLLYPNPTKNTLNIRVSNDFGLPNNYTIYNTLGQIISQKKVASTSDLTINTSSLSNGIYYIKIEKDGQKKSLSFVKE